MTQRQKLFDPLQYSYDEQRDILTVEGIRYTGGLFRSFGGLAVGSLVEIIERKDGGLMLRDHRTWKPGG